MSSNNNAAMAIASTSTTSTEKVYQLKIALQFIKPPIWRRIEVPESYNFFDLHVAIQDLFNWSGDHLHKFELAKTRKERHLELLHKMMTGNYELEEYIGIPDRSFVNDCKILPEKETKIGDQFSLVKNRTKFWYIYDFGSEWRHDIILEKISDALPNVTYPRCIAGKRSPPPEHYTDEDHSEDPFSITDITFRDPVLAWQKNPFKRF